jgi:hypothetical protein
MDACLHPLNCAPLSRRMRKSKRWVVMKQVTMREFKQDPYWYMSYVSTYMLPKELAQNPLTHR